MNPIHLIITELERNKDVFRHLFQGLTKAWYTYEITPGKWNLLQILCHLHDEEKEDFRTRVNCVLHQPERPLTPIDPIEWVSSRDYAGQDYEKMLKLFLEERQSSVDWLKNLKSPKWENVHLHPKFGSMRADFFLANWLEHDYLHIRQILNVKHHYLKQISGQELNYAGEW